MNSQTPENNQHHPRWKKEVTSPSFWVGILTLVALTVYTAFTHQQVTETRKANLIAKKALTEVNKPYVLAASISPNFTRDNNGSHLRIGWTLSNLGNTPANHIRYTNCDPIIRDSATKIIKCNVTEEKSVDLILGPKQTTQVAGSIIEPAILKKTTDGRAFIYILGFVTYEDEVDVDADGKPEERVTRFCSQVEQAEPIAALPSGTVNATVTQDPAGTQQLIIAGLGCPSFTCIDAACEKL